MDFLGDDYSCAPSIESLFIAAQLQSGGQAASLGSSLSPWPMLSMCLAALGRGNPTMPEEALSEREHLRTGVSANGVTHDDPPAGTQSSATSQNMKCASGLSSCVSLTSYRRATTPSTKTLHKVRSTYNETPVTTSVSLTQCKCF